jgi:hypothetical protein
MEVVIVLRSGPVAHPNDLILVGFKTRKSHLLKPVHDVPLHLRSDDLAGGK